MNKKLTPHERRAIYRLGRSGVQRNLLAASFGVHPSTVTRIVQGAWVTAGREYGVRGVVTNLDNAPGWRDRAWKQV